MKVSIEFDSSTSKLIRDGYYEKHKKHLDDHLTALPYSDLPEYIKLGKRVRRRHVRDSFIDDWGAVILWIIVVAGLIGWNAYQGNRHHQDSRSTSSYSHSSKSGIYYSETCEITTCSDGACSTSTGRGTCSHHDGIRN